MKIVIEFQDDEDGSAHKKMEDYLRDRRAMMALTEIVDQLRDWTKYNTFPLPETAATIDTPLKEELVYETLEKVKETVWGFIKDNNCDPYEN